MASRPAPRLSATSSWSESTAASAAPRIRKAAGRNARTCATTNPANVSAGAVPRGEKPTAGPGGEGGGASGPRGGRGGWGAAGGAGRPQGEAAGGARRGASVGGG